jgi:hypothetical protein
MEKIKAILLHHRHVLLVVRNRLVFVGLHTYERKKDITYIPREVHIPFIGVYCVPKDRIN